MSITTHARTTTTYSMTVGDHEFPTEFPAEEYIDPKVEINGVFATITYATRDEDTMDPRRHYGATIGTMVRVRDGYNGIDIDQPDSEVADAFEAARHLLDVPWTDETFYLVQCGCAWGQHDLVAGAPADCSHPNEILLFGDRDEIYPDGSSRLMEFAFADYNQGITGIAAMIELYTDHRRQTNEYDLLDVYIAHAMPSITGFMQWNTTGYCQGDWAEGYIYTTSTDVTDVQAALKSEVEEYEAWANGNVYAIVQEEYTLHLNEDDAWGQVSCESVGGYYGEDYAQRVITNGEAF